MSSTRLTFEQGAKLRPDDPIGAIAALEILEGRYPGKFDEAQQKQIVDAVIAAKRFIHLSIDDRVRF